MVSFHVQDFKFIFFKSTSTSSNVKPPTAERPAAIVNGCALVGKKVCAVPVVPHRIAPSKTNMYGNAANTSTPCKIFLLHQNISHIEIVLVVFYNNRDRRHLHMYMTVEEIANYLSMPIEQIKRYIAEKKIRAIFDGEQYYVNSAQFETHLHQVEDLKRQIDEWRNTPIPDDIDVKDED